MKTGRFKFNNHPVGADFRQDPDWKMNSLLVGQPGHLRGHAVGGTRWEWLKWRCFFCESGRVHDESLQDDPWFRLLIGKWPKRSRRVHDLNEILAFCRDKVCCSCIFLTKDRSTKITQWRLAKVISWTYKNGVFIQSSPCPDMNYAVVSNMLTNIFQPVWKHQLVR